MAANSDTDGTQLVYGLYTDENQLSKKIDTLFLTRDRVRARDVPHISTNIRFLILACLTFLDGYSPAKPTVRPNRPDPLRKVRTGGTMRYEGI